MEPAISEVPPPVLILLAHEVRWQLVRALALSDYRVQELASEVGRPLNLVSYHLKQLREHQLVSERRSSADARDMYYHLDLDRLHTLYRASGTALHPVVTEYEPVPAVDTKVGAPARMLFLCTHNSARSQMAEGIARTLGKGRINAFSAGSEPTTIHPDAVRAMAAIGIDISQQTSKHLNQFRNQSFDYIITVCDRVRETCPVFPDDPEHIHWSFPDPAIIEDPYERYRQFQTIARELAMRIGQLKILFERKQAGR
jgi:ArsR family transcriptional regulator, arsenate/arsenite/antimonite-responsive transcriptional repressor / arsenate reductase (thioredoxin)